VFLGVHRKSSSRQTAVHVPFTSDNGRTCLEASCLGQVTRHPQARGCVETHALSPVTFDSEVVRSRTSMSFALASRTAAAGCFSLVKLVSKNDPG